MPIIFVVIALVLLTTAAQGQESIVAKTMPASIDLFSPHMAYPPIAPPKITTVTPVRRGIRLPPLEYDYVYKGKLTITFVATVEELRRICNQPNKNPIGCAWGGVLYNKPCDIYMLNETYMREHGHNTGDLLRHEMGHCNGWAADHPGARYANE